MRDDAGRELAQALADDPGIEGPPIEPAIVEPEALEETATSWRAKQNALPAR
jgi:hypothetical protein